MTDKDIDIDEINDIVHQDNQASTISHGSRAKTTNLWDIIPDDVRSIISSYLESSNSNSHGKQHHNNIE